MSRVVTLKDRIKKIKRAYKRVNGFRFLYNNKSDLKRKYNRLRIWLLIHDADKGYSIFIYEHKRVLPYSVKEWHRLFTKDNDKYIAIYTVITQALLPAINNKGGSAWRFISLLAWAGMNDIRQNKNSRANQHRNKTSKTRSPNAPNTNRRGH